MRSASDALTSSTDGEWADSECPLRPVTNCLSPRLTPWVEEPERLEKEWISFPFLRSFRARKC